MLTAGGSHSAIHKHARVCVSVCDIKSTWKITSEEFAQCSFASIPRRTGQFNPGVRNPFAPIRRGGGGTVLCLSVARPACCHF